jgi:hypothetical protein
MLEINQPHPHTRRLRGKSDAIDAEAAARKALVVEKATIPKETRGIVEAIRMLRIAREGAVKGRAAAYNQLFELIVTAPDELRQQLKRKTLRGQATLCARLRPDRKRLQEPLQAARLALRSVARRALELDRSVRALDGELGLLLERAVPRTVALLGVSTGHASTLLVAAGQNIERLRSEACFAHLCAASPIKASSGRRQRHRLDYGGNRDASRALHMIAVVRLRYCQRTRAYAARRSAEGLSKREIIRCLKRYIARQLYHSLRADLADLAATTASPGRAIAISCGAGPSGITRTNTNRAPQRPKIVPGSSIPEARCPASGSGKLRQSQGGSQSRARRA